MYSKLPYMVYGFHGCDQSVKDRILKEQGFFAKSTNSYDWLGHGIYFWENDYERAMEFAEDVKEHPMQSKGSITSPAVIGVVIDFGYCLNLLNRQYIKLLEMANQYYVLAAEAKGVQIAENRGLLPDRKGRYRDCAVINNLHLLLEDMGAKPFDTVRGMFFEGDPIYDKAGFYQRTHIQICVRNPNCIKAIFDPRKLDNSYPET